MSGRMDTFFEVEGARRWKREIDELVRNLKNVLKQIENKVKEVSEEDSIAKKWKQMGRDVQTAFAKLIECVKMIVTAIANIIKRMVQTMQEIDENHNCHSANYLEAFSSVYSEASSGSNSMMGILNCCCPTK